MIHYSCKNCGAQLDLGQSGSLSCPYCGSKAFLSDKEFRGNKEFRKKLLSYYKACNDAKEMSYENDTLWECAGRDTFTTAKGQAVNIEYMKKYSYKDMVCYLAKETVVYVFSDNKSSERFMQGLNSLTFPEADTKLYRSFPELKTIVDLSEGKAVVFTRRPHFYPLEFFVPMKNKHSAWVISRMENICCALEFSELEHKDISSSSIFINVETHEGVLFGDWRGVSKKVSNKDLLSIREVGKEISEDTSKPAEFKEFLNSKPKSSAFDDFSYWDSVIEKGFGGHNFNKYE
ncbi:MAG: hypothetical protein MJ123_02440 [Lachnospiraceae bacterium]|nr:hypothetical protein [Lachnospiraceae bacterium]